MTKQTIATLLTGGDGFGIGAKAAGLKPIWGVEIDPDIAFWAERNSPGLSVIRGDVAAVDYASLERPWWLHASPECKRASTANQASAEGEEDMGQAEGIVRALEALRPPVFSLENVWAYRAYESFGLILRALSSLGYYADFWHLNAADYGVAQTRKRLILLASREGRVWRPQSTHIDPGKIGQPTLFDIGLRPWVGWYEAIEDLIPELPDSQFADWQLKRLPEDIKGMLIGVGGYNGNIVTVENNQPSFCITSTMSRQIVRAFVIGSQYGQPNTQKDRAAQIRFGPQPYFSVTVSGGQHQDQRAFLIPSANASNNTVRYGDEPTVTVGDVKRSRNAPRAFVGRVVKMTPRALARFQSFPDSYELPEAIGLACRIIGNAVPPLLVQRIVESVK